MLTFFRIIHFALAAVIAWILIKAGLRYLLGEQVNEVIAFMSLMLSYEAFGKVLEQLKKQDNGNAI